MRMMYSGARIILVTASLGLSACGDLPEEEEDPEGVAFAPSTMIDGGIRALDAAIDARIVRGRDGGPDAAASPGFLPDGCSDLFDPKKLWTYEVQISDVEWKKLTDEFLRPVPNENENGYLHPYHPAVVKLGDEVRTDVMIRLKGDSSWLETVTTDKNPKAQFVLAFDRVDKSARFHGVEKLEFDMARTDPTYLRDRVGHRIMRDLGLGGTCAGSARLAINGQYYGLYVVQESLDKTALRRIFPDAPNGALWKEGYELETKETPEVLARQEAWVAATDIPSMLKIIDLDQAIYEWAAEIVMNNADGYYGGDHNFYLYDHPRRGFLWVPTDLDSTFDYIEWTSHPIYWWESHDPEQTAGHHYRAVITHPVWRAKLVDAIAKVIAQWNVPHIQSLIDQWSAQVAASVRDDPHRWASLTEVRRATAALRDTVLRRPEFLQSFIRCERTNTGTDADRDGVPWCKDCNDRRATVRPGAREICRNRRDDDCDGLKDEGCR